MDLNVKKLKKMVTDPVVIDLVAAHLVAEAKAEATKELVDAYIEPVFESFRFYVEDEIDRDTPGVSKDGKIEDIEILYLTDLSSDNYKAFIAACREAHLAGPFASIVKAREEEHGDLGFCPACIAEHEFINAKNKLAKHVAEEWLGLEDIHYPHTEKLNKLVIGAVLKGPAGESLSLPVLVA